MKRKIRQTTVDKPRIPRERILVAVTHHPDHELRCARAYGVGAEIQAFSFPHVLSGDFNSLLNRMVRRVSRVNGPIGCHGAFIDTCHFSPDPEIRRVAYMRYIQSMDIAQRLGAAFVIFHSQYNSIIRITDYPDIYHRESLEVWPKLIEEAVRRDLLIYLENMFDDSPEPLRRLMDAIDSPDFKVCLDIAHAAVFSNKSLDKWVGALKPHLRHIHMNDCDGRFDEHRGLGQGALDLPHAFQLLDHARDSLTYTLETGLNTAPSLRYLGLRKIQKTG